MIFSKRHGLAKLRLITNKLPGLASFAPYKVYTKPSQYHAKHAQEKPRLLLRTDVPERRYRAAGEWWTVPRGEMQTTTAEEVSRKMEELKYVRRLVYVVHPTRPREDIDWVGGIMLINNPDGLHANLYLSRPKVTQINWREMDKWEQKEFSFVIKDGHFYESPESREVLQMKSYSTLQPIVSRAIAFLNLAVKMRQIKLNGSREFTIWFNTWKDNPHLLEFFDFQERRKSIIQRKKK